jgi:serine/threonine protein kinase
MDELQKAHEIFEEALKMSPLARSAFIDDRCDDKSSLRNYVLAMLDGFEHASGKLSSPIRFPNCPEGQLLQPGDALGEDDDGRRGFRIDEFVAEGGMGQVYRAYDFGMGIPVAIKTLHPDLLVEPLAVDLFQKETQISINITSEYVCRVYGFFPSLNIKRKVGLSDPPVSKGVAKKVAAVSMEYLDGESLGSRIRNGPIFSTMEALPLIEQMSAALSAAHKQGVIHRDFKPDNVMLVVSHGAPRAKVTDFGLACIGKDAAPSVKGSYWERLRASGKPGAAGTFLYMAPEQFHGEATRQSDIYALGLVIFEMVTGRRPLEGDDWNEIENKRRNGPPQSPRNINPGLSQHWEAVILRCLDPDPKARFNSAEDVFQALSQQRTTTPSPEMSQSFWRPLLDRIEEGNVIPVIGRDLLMRPDGRNFYREIAAQVAADLGLSDVALSQGDELSEIAYHLKDRGKLNLKLMSERVRIVASDLLRNYPIPEPLQQLASISPLKLFITTTFDPLMEKALNQVRYDGMPSTKVRMFAPSLPGSPGDLLDEDLLSARVGRHQYPVVFHLLGKLGMNPLNYVVTQEDVVEFFHCLQSEKRPTHLLGELRNPSHSLLILGLKFNDWVSRFFVRIANDNRLHVVTGKSTFYLADKYADQNFVLFLRTFNEETEIYPGSGAVEFVQELHERWNLRVGGIGLNSLSNKVQHRHASGTV